MKTELKTGILMLVVWIAIIGMTTSLVAAEKNNNNSKDNLASIQSIIEKLGASGNNTNEIWKNLSDKEKKDVIEYLKADKVITNVTTVYAPKVTANKEKGKGITPLWTISRSVTASTCGYNLWGSKVWCYSQTIDWSYNGSAITSKFRTRWGQVYYFWWSFDGHTGNSEQGGAGQSSYRAWTQGAFKYCPIDWGCIQYAYPWIDMTVYASGSYKSSTGGA